MGGRSSVSLKYHVHTLALGPGSQRTMHLLAFRLGELDVAIVLASHYTAEAPAGELEPTRAERAINDLIAMSVTEGREQFEMLRPLFDFQQWTYFRFVGNHAPDEPASRKSHFHFRFSFLRPPGSDGRRLNA